VAVSKSKTQQMRTAGRLDRLRPPGQPVRWCESPCVGIWVCGCVGVGVCVSVSVSVPVCLYPCMVCVVREVWWWVWCGWSGRGGGCDVGPRLERRSGSAESGSARLGHSLPLTTNLSKNAPVLLAASPALLHRCTAVCSALVAGHAQPPPATLPDPPSVSPGPGS
jgi:hypothetical protein